MNHHQVGDAGGEIRELGRAGGGVGEIDDEALKFAGFQVEAYRKLCWGGAPGD